MLGHFLKETLRNLKQEYGQPIVITRRVIGPQDLSTGTRTTDETNIKIAKAIRLTKKNSNIFMSLNSTLDKNIKNTDRRFLIMGTDLPTNYVPKENDHILVGTSDRYIVKDVDGLDLNLGYIIVAEKSS